MSIRTATLGAASLLAAAVFAGPALADGMPSRGRIADAPGPRTCSLGANIGYTTDYVFRGISQNNENGAVQGGVDLTCGNLYLGAWGSNVYLEGTHEVDIYGGYKTRTGPINWDLGFIYYAYPGTAGGDINYLELKVGASGNIWKGGTLGGTVFYSPDYNGFLGDTVTLEGTFAQELPKVGIFAPTFSATLGNVNLTDHDFDYTYWNVGLTVGFREKWSVDVRYWDSDLGHFDCWGLTGLASVCDSRIVGTVKYSF